MLKKQTDERYSNFELLRIVAMFFIILYHLLYFFIEPLSGGQALYRGLQIPFHTGVILFVLISGYFTIKPSLKGILLLTIPVFVYYVPLNIWANIVNDDIVEAIKSILFITHSPYWYVRTYLLLYLSSPIINCFLEQYKENNKILLTTLFILAFISCYVGVIGVDASLEGGKNVVNFIFIYVLGFIIKHNKSMINRIPIKIEILFYLLLNSFLVLTYTLVNNDIVRAIIIKTCFLYCSPVLIFNAILLFHIFSRIYFKNKLVNMFAKSTYAMYIIHHQPYVLYGLIGTIISSFWSYSHNTLYIMGMGGVFTLVIMMVSFIIYKITNPIILKFVNAILRARIIKWLNI